ncbi:hypothetical protein [Bacillus sp. 165]|uniref:hypothetical protein n=1 Tax=Bacillus sp. 165 TaxID=1529117 RepID=UPI001AD977E8|nr:hypothetical protein [Bacillus sp. 165]MBO9129277.1 hypothetical protein [Bacillus sp. 165]
MKSRLVILCWVLFLVSNRVSAEEPTLQKQTLVVGNEKEEVFLYATPNKREGIFTNFTVKIKDELIETYGWEVEMREERQPELHVIDLNNDGEKEIVVILTIGTGTWIIQKQAHILQKVETPNGLAYEEMDIDNPVHTIERDYEITATNNIIKVEGRGHSWKTINTCGKTLYRHRFPLSQSVDWKVDDNNLVSEVGLTITYNCVPASFVLRYKQNGEIYIAKQVKVNL